MVVLAFLDSQSEYRDSDAKWQDYATYMLTDFCFLYKHSDDDSSRKVREQGYILHVCLDDTIPQKWKGLFLLIETFAAHLIASKGAQKVQGLNDASEATPVATGALGMAAASVRIVYCHHVLFWPLLGGEGTVIGCNGNIDN